jgi:hypothetical protein
VHLACTENPALRRGQHPGHATDALDAGKPHADPAAASPNASLRQQLELLDRTVDGHYAFPEDRALARIADSQGLAERWVCNRPASGQPPAMREPREDCRAFNCVPTPSTTLANAVLGACLLAGSRVCRRARRTIEPRAYSNGRSA